MKPLWEMSAKELAKADARKTAYHEAGHIVAVERYGAKWKLAKFDRQPATLEQTGIKAARVEFYGLGLTGFQFAVVGWAGVVAKLNSEERTREELPLDAQDYYLNSDIDTYLSDTDRQSIAKTKQRWRALKTAMNIIKREWVAVKDTAEGILDGRIAPRD